MPIVKLFKPLKNIKNVSARSHGACFKEKMLVSCFGMKIPLLKQFKIVSTRKYKTKGKKLLIAQT